MNANEGVRMPTNDRRIFMNATTLLARVIRMLVMVIVMGAVVLGSITWWASSKEAALRAEVEQLEVQLEQAIAAREAAIQRLSRTQRLARIEVLEPPNGQASSTRIRFTELGDDGRELASQEFVVPGREVHVDAWTARFPTEQVVGNDPLRGQTLILLRRIYSELMPPINGHAIDTPGSVPNGYAGTDKGRYEQAIWRNFWRIATNPAQARQHGVRVAQGEAIYKPMAPGEVYDLRIESHGGMTLIPVETLASAER